MQGVGFRVFVAGRARSRSVAGWIRNRPDGSVEAVFEGDRDLVEGLLEAVRDGPLGARVDAVDVVEEEPEGLDGFEVR